MGGIVNSIGNLFGGSAAKTDRKNQLGGMGDLSNLFNYGFSSGKTGEASASDQLGKAGSYYSSLLSGDRNATLQAVAPTVNAATAQTDAAKRNLSQSGTARGGGVNATAQTLDDSKRSTIDNAIAGAKGTAAEGATRVGGTMASQAGNLLGLGETAATNLTDLAGNSRKTSDELHKEKVKAAADLTNQVLTAMFAT